MKNPLNKPEQRKVRRRYSLPQPTKSARRTTMVAVLALIVILAAAGLLELRRGGGAEAELATHVRTAGEDPLDLVETAGRAHRLLFIADVPSALAPKRFAQQAVQRLARTSGLDLVVLDIDADEQPFIDRYLATAPEDASILMGRPRAIREGDGASRALVDLYRAVWKVNEELGAARRIRIVAADAPGWPPGRATSPNEAARLFGERSNHMIERVNTRELGRNPNARVLFFVDGLHALKSGGARVQSGGSRPVDARWLAAQLRERYPADVFTILVDATASRSIAADVAAYRGTEIAEALRRAGVPPGKALRAHATLDGLSRTPIRVVGTTGLDFSLDPRSARFSELADAYVYFGN